MNPAELVGTEIIVPGSIANLGPGLDTLAVAVQLYLRVRITSVSSTERGSLHFDFGRLQLTGENRIETAFRKLADGNREFPSLHLAVDSEIPMGSGLGSSAAATIAGFRLWEELFGTESIDRLLTAATDLEGHGDNAAAALLGGLAICCENSDGSMGAFSVPWPESLCLIVLTPAVALSTETSRKALPKLVTLKDAVSNMQRSLLLLHSLQSGDDRLLMEALRDRLHQPSRESLVPGLADALQLTHPDLLGMFLSGSGPSIVGLARNSCREIEQLMAQSYRPLGIPFETSILQAHSLTLTHASAVVSCS